MNIKNKKILFNKEHFENIESSLEYLYNVVSPTLGPCGKNVLIERLYLNPLITKDGATVAENVFKTDDNYPIINLIKSITKSVANESGDGTTSTTVLAYNLYKNYKKELENNKNNNIRVLEVTNALRNITNSLVKELKILSTEIKTVDELINIIKVSNNNDKHMTDLIIKALNIKDNDIETAKGRDIVVSLSKNGKDYIEVINGSRYDCGYLSPLFANDKTNSIVEFQNPYVVISADKIYSIQQIEKILEIAIQSNKPIVIIAPEIVPEVIAVLATNKMKGVLQVAAIQAPGFGGSSTYDYLSDIGVLAGCKVIKADTAISFDNLTEAHIGKKITYFKADATKTTLVSNVNKNEIKARVNEIERLIQETENNAALVDLYKKRLNKLTNGLSFIYLASNSEVELFERRDRLEDSVGAVKSALAEGYVPGQGSTYCKLASILEEKYKDILVNSEAEKIAYKILFNSLLTVFDKVLENAELENKKEISNINEGVDLVTGNKIKLIESGIIDPTKVIRVALEYSISLISTLISSDSSILLLNRDLS